MRPKDAFTDEQIARFRAIEKMRAARGESRLREFFDECIKGLDPNNETAALVIEEPVRVAQARRLFELGVGTEFGTFEKYLATIPDIPTKLLEDDPNFPLLVLVDPRQGLTKLCALGDVFIDRYVGINFYDKQERGKGPYWIRIQNGEKYKGLSVDEWKEKVEYNEIGLTVFEGVCTHLQWPNIIKNHEVSDGHAMDLPGSYEGKGITPHLVMREDLKVYLGRASNLLRGEKFGQATKHAF